MSAALLRRSFPALRLDAPQTGEVGYAAPNCATTIRGRVRRRRVKATDRTGIVTWEPVAAAEAALQRMFGQDVAWEGSR